MYKSMMLEFPVEEYRARVDKLIAGMQKHGMDAILLSSKENTRYFSGLQSIVWDSKIAVPGLLIVTANGDMTIVSSTSNQPTVTVTSCIEPEKLLAYSRTSEPGFPDTFPKAVAYALEKFNVKTGRIGMEIGHGFRVAAVHAAASPRQHRQPKLLIASQNCTTSRPPAKIPTISLQRRHSRQIGGIALQRRQKYCDYCFVSITIRAIFALSQLLLDLCQTPNYESIYSL